MKNKVWDLKPDHGGDPVEVTMLTERDATEAIERDPERYTREAPEGSPEHARLEKQREHNAKLAEINASESKAVAEITKAEREQLAANAKAAAETRRVAEEKA